MITNRSMGYVGRLANQIFQHATLISVGVKKGYIVKLPGYNEVPKPDGCYDFANRKWLTYKLDLYNCFDLKTEKCSEEEANGLKNRFNEAGFSFDPNVFNVSDSTSIEGYYQSYKYFDDVRQDVLNEFKFKPQIAKEAEDVLKPISNREVVSIHIRRQDYVGSTTLGLVGLEYFSQALEKFTDNDYNFLIVSDDIKWCKETFELEENVFFSDGHSHYVDLCILSKCQHNIICNSTFSWYGAWANQNPNKRIIAPSQWFRPGVDFNTKDLYPPEWIVI